MMASVAPKSLGAKEVGEQIAVLIKDNGDGSYSGMYTVSARGNYEVGLLDALLSSEGFSDEFRTFVARVDLYHVVMPSNLFIVACPCFRLSCCRAFKLVHCSLFQFPLLNLHGTALQLIVEINAVPTGGSPYPVFFSPPEAEETGPAAEALPGDARAAALADATGPAATNSLAATAQEVARMLQPDLARISAATDAATAAMLAQQNSMVSVRGANCCVKHHPYLVFIGQRHVQAITAFKMPLLYVGSDGCTRDHADDKCTSNGGLCDSSWPAS